MSSLPSVPAGYNCCYAVPCAPWRRGVHVAQVGGLESLTWFGFCRLYARLDELEDSVPFWRFGQDVVAGWEVLDVLARQVFFGLF